MKCYRWLCDIVLLKDEKIWPSETVPLALEENTTMQTIKPGTSPPRAHWWAHSQNMTRGRGDSCSLQWWITRDPDACNISQGWECIINWNPCLVPPCRPLYNCISTWKTIFSRIHNGWSVLKMCRKEICSTYKWLYQNIHRDTESRIIHRPQNRCR